MASNVCWNTEIPFSLNRDSEVHSRGHLSVIRVIARMFFVLVSIVSAVSLGEAQEVSISITPEIDSLHAQLLRSPGDRILQRKLIDSYILTFNPELALLEILSTENAADAKVKGLTQMSLEQVQPALRSLQQAYLQSPFDETLLFIGLLYYARGDAGRGAPLLGRVRSRIPHISVELLKLYERFYLNGRKQIAMAAALALRDVDPAFYQSYFPQPAVSILSPTADYTTEAHQTSIIFEVRHSRPVKIVEIQRKPVYDRGSEKVGSPNEEYRQNFSELIQLHEGRNVVVAEATDVFGNSGSDTVIVNGLNFNRPVSWTSGGSDSLKRMFQYFRNYVPDSVLLAEKMSSYRALIVSGERTGDSSTMNERGLVLYELLTNPISGIVQPANVKLLLKDRMKSRNISLVMKDWLLKGATFQSVSIVYLGGEWRFSADRWELYDNDGELIDMKPLLEQLKVVATAGVVLLLDGVGDQRNVLVQNIQRLAQASAVPLEVLVLPAAGDWMSPFLAAMSAAGSRKTPDGAALFLTVRQLERMVPGSLSLNPRTQPIKIAQNPMGLVVQKHENLLTLLQRKLGADKVPTATKTKLIDFCKDWRRYHEMARFLSNTLSLSDFVVRVDEYRSRTADGRN